MQTHWVEDTRALALLDEPDSPFSSRAYREAWVHVHPQARDASFGAVAPDGTRAAVALILEGGAAYGVPLGYGDVASTRELTTHETAALLATARRRTGAAEVIVRQVRFSAGSSPAGGATIATTDCVDLRDGHPEARFAKKARQSIRRAQRAGASVPGAAQSPEAFLALYEPAANSRGVVYPREIFRLLADAGLAAYYTAWIDGEPVSSLVALRGGSHWMYWAAAQNETGRRAEAGYLVAARMITEAASAGVQWVNLGASASAAGELQGVAQFKRRLGGVPTPVVELRSIGAMGKLRRAAARTVSGLRRE